MRYRLLAQWALDRGLAALLTAHHLDDQAETFLMRLARGAGVKGLAGMRRLSRGPAAGIAVVRPLLGWRHSELEAICAAAGIEPVQDPSNEDEQFERVRIRGAPPTRTGSTPRRLRRSAANLAEADGALHWATEIEWQRAVKQGGGQITYTADRRAARNPPPDLRRAVLALATEGSGAEPRGRELDQLLAALRAGKRTTLRGVLGIGGPEWRFTRAPARRSESQRKFARRNGSSSAHARSACCSS